MSEEKPKTEEEKDKGGRPTKLTEKFLEVAEKVLSDDINAIILTDEELIDAINEKLDGDEKITKRTFRNWKSKIQKEDVDELDEKGRGFFLLLKKALREQKQNLFDKFGNDDKWQKWAWIIERKFDEWNIKRKIKTEHTGSAMYDMADSLRKLAEEDEQDSEDS